MLRWLETCNSSPRSTKSPREESLPSAHLTAAMSHYATLGTTRDADEVLDEDAFLGAADYSTLSTDFPLPPPHPPIFLCSHLRMNDLTSRSRSAGRDKEGVS